MQKKPGVIRAGRLRVSLSPSALPRIGPPTPDGWHLERDHSKGKRTESPSSRWSGGRAGLGTVPWCPDCSATGFAHYFKAESLRTLKLVQTLRESGLPVVATLRAFEVRSRMPALNSWEHVYWSAVTGNAEMLDFLENGELPDFL